MTQTVGHTTELRDVRGVQACLRRGGSGRPVLFLHGAGGAGVWLPFHGMLAEAGFDLLAPDHPGFGASGEMQHIEAMDDLVYHYLDLLDGLGLERVDVVGTSLGGWLAAELAVHSPERVRRLVLLNAVGLDIWEAQPKDLFGMNPEETVAAVFADPAVAASLFPAEPDLDFIMGLYREKVSFARLAWNPYCCNPKLESRLYRITAPTLVVWGEKDELVPLVHGERYVQGIADARLEVIPGVAHAPFLEAPEATAKVIVDFLEA